MALRGLRAHVDGGCCTYSSSVAQRALRRCIGKQISIHRSRQDHNHVGDVATAGVDAAVHHPCDLGDPLHGAAQLGEGLRVDPILPLGADHAAISTQSVDHLATGGLLLDVFHQKGSGVPEQLH